MNIIIDIFTNRIVLCGLLSWAVAQFLKVVTGLIKYHKFSFAWVMASGGMPSSHSSLVCSVTTMVGKNCGFGSVEFAICTMMAMITMYDAAGVRRAAGEQAKILNKLMEALERGKTEEVPKKLKELIGHTKLEVFAGAALGVLIALLF